MATKLKALWKKCDGEAHSNPYIDHCMICLPYWETYPVCTLCGRKLTRPKGYCQHCKKHFDLGDRNV